MRILRRHHPAAFPPPVRRPLLGLLAGAMASLLLAAPAIPDELALKVRVLHTADLHGSLAAWDDATNKPAA